MEGFEVLFICTGNTCRSPMAAALARAMAGERGVAVTVASAGIAAAPGEPASPEAVAVLREWGIDLQGHAARQLDAGMVRAAGLVLTMTRSHKAAILALAPEARDKVFTLKEYVRLIQEEQGTAGSKGVMGDEDVADPINRPLAFYRDVAGELRRTVALLMDHLAGRRRGARHDRGGDEQGRAER